MVVYDRGKPKEVSGALDHALILTIRDQEQMDQRKYADRISHGREQRTDNVF